MLDSRDYQIALQSGLGTVSADISSGVDRLASGVDRLADSINFGFDKLTGGIDKLNSDFNVLMGNIIWKLEVQNENLASVLKTLQSPLDTAATELRRRAEDAYQNGWYEESLSDFLESERKNYQDFSVHRSIGNIYLYHLIDLPKALEYFHKAAKYARPRDVRQAAEAEYFIGIVCSLQQQLQEASEHMHEAIKLNQQLYDAFYMRAGFSAILGDTVTATKSLRTAIKGDFRYYERSKTDPMFDKVRSESFKKEIIQIVHQIEKNNDAKIDKELRINKEKKLAQDRKDLKKCAVEEMRKKELAKEKKIADLSVEAQRIDEKLANIRKTRDKQKREAGECENCGTKLSFFSKILGNTRCKLHRTR